MKTLQESWDLIQDLRMTRTWIAEGVEAGRGGSPYAGLALHTLRRRDECGCCEERRGVGRGEKL